MKPIILPIFYDDETDVMLEDLGVNINNNLDEKKTKQCYFFNIDCLLPYESNGNTYTEIVSGGKHLICPFSPKALYQTINSNR